MTKEKTTRKAARTEKVSAKEKFVQEFAAKVIDAIKNGTAPWQLPWTGKLGKSQTIDMPHNPVSGTIYKGVNFMNLMFSGYNDPRFVTFNQAKENGWKVKKGAKGEKIIYWNFIEKTFEDKDTGEDVKKAFPLMRISTVFNACHIEGMGEYVSNPIEFDPHERAEKLVQSTGVRVHHDQNNKAFYRSGSNDIHLPKPELFINQERYYSTLLHELTHWTGLPHLCNRDKGNYHTSKVARAKEELVAEIGSWMLCCELGIDNTEKDHASYVDGWASVLKKEPTAILTACSQAEKAKACILSFEEKPVLKQKAA